MRLCARARWRPPIGLLCRCLLARTYGKGLAAMPMSAQTAGGGVGTRILGLPWRTQSYGQSLHGPAGTR